MRPYSQFLVHSCARLAHRQSEEQLQNQRNVNEYERLKRTAELDRIKKEAELELMEREREEEREDLRKRIDLDYNRRIKEIAAEAEAQQARYVAAKNEDDIKRWELEREFERETRELNVAKEKQAMDLEQKERDQDLEVKKQKETLELDVKQAEADQSRKHADEDHALDRKLREGTHKFNQELEQYTQMKKLAIEEEFAQKMVLDAEVAAADGKKKGRIRASKNCPPHLLSVLMGAMNSPALVAPPQPKALEGRTEREEPPQSEKTKVQASDHEDETKPDPSTGAAQNMC